MYGNSYSIPGASGLIAVNAEAGAESVVEAALEDFAASFTSFRDRNDATIADLNRKVSGIANDMLEIEQRVIDRNPSDYAPARRDPAAVLAKHLMADANFKAVAEKRNTKTRIEVDATMLLGPVENNTVVGDTGGLNSRDRQPGIVNNPERRRWLRQLFQSIPVAGNLVEYQREVTYVNAAAPQASEGASKAETSVTFEPVETKVPTLAHFIKASNQVLADALLLRQFLDARLRYGLELLVENQILNGDGTGANMSGLTLPANHVAFVPTSGDSAIDSLNRSLASIETAEGMPDLIIMHPQDHRAMQRVKTSGSGEYLYGSPSGANGANVWNTPIYTTPAMTLGSFITLDRAQAAVMFSRQEATIDLGFVNDDFTRNLVTIRGEGRMTIAVQRPQMVRFGPLTL